MARLPLPSIKNANLKVGKKITLSGWLVFDGIALIVIVGVLAARMSHAGGNYVFIKSPQQMSGGSLARDVASGEYRHVVAGGVHGETTAVVTTADITGSSQICADFRTNSAKNFIDIQLNGHYANKFVASSGNATVCADLNSDYAGGTIYAGTSGDVNVLSIYGVK